MLESPNARMLRRLAKQVDEFRHELPAGAAEPEERDVVREEPDTQFLIDEMQGYAKYTDELKAKVVGLMAGIRAFSATLSKA